MEKNPKIQKGQTEMIKSEDRQDCDQQKRNERQTNYTQHYTAN